MISKECSDLEDEKRILALLVQAHNCYAELESQHPEDINEWTFHLHGLQQLLMIRRVRRIYPNEFPIYTKKEDFSMNDKSDKILYKRAIVTICGSTRFRKEIEEAAKELTLDENIVLMPNVFGHAGDTISDEQKEALDKLHLEKIKMSDFIYVVNKNNYIGKSTRKEIDYARCINIPVVFMIPTSL